MKGERVCASVYRMGTVSSAPATPKNTSKGLRPMRSDSAPQRLQDQREDQRGGDHIGGDDVREPRRLPDEGLHGGEGVEGRRAAVRPTTMATSRGYFSARSELVRGWVLLAAL